MFSMFSSLFLDIQAVTCLCLYRDIIIILASFLQYFYINTYFFPFICFFFLSGFLSFYFSFFTLIFPLVLFLAFPNSLKFNIIMYVSRAESVIPAQKERGPSRNYFFIVGRKAYEELECTHAHIHAYTQTYTDIR